MNEREYLGDAVWVEFDGYHIVLRANSPVSEHPIYLNNSTAWELKMYLDKMFGLNEEGEDDV